MKKRVPFSFIVKYALQSEKKGRFRKRLTTFVCAGAVAFAAMCTGYLGGYSSMQSEYLKNISERELAVFNNFVFENMYSADNPPISEENVERIKQLDYTEFVVPVVKFTAGDYGASKAALQDLTQEERGEEERKREVAVVSVKNAKGINELVEFDVFSGDNYTAVSYSSAEWMDNKALCLDETASEGAYLTESFLQRLDLTLDDVDGLVLTLDVWVNTHQIEVEASMSTETDDGGYEKTKETVYSPWSQKITVAAPVRGVINNTVPMLEGNIFLPPKLMLEAIESCPDESNYMERNVQQTEEYTGEKLDPYFLWAPNAYYVVAKSIEDVEPLKVELKAIDPNFEVISVYQDIKAGTQIADNNRNIMLYISFAVLAVALLLMALIYVSLIDRRKFEFAVLRANGFTKKEVRKLIYTEMIWQFLKIFLFGIICATLIYLIGCVWLGYPFQFDGMTALWVFVISLGSIILPTIISLLFVNKFEPDQVMRN